MEKQISIPQLRFPEFKDKWNEEKMGEIYSFKVTNSFSRDNLNYEEGTVKNIHYGDIHTKFQTLFDITKETVPFINSDISIDRISEDNYCKEGDLILADASEDLNDVGKSIEIFNLNNEKLLAGLHTILARPNLEKLDIGFGGYLFKSNKVRTKIQKEAQGSKVLSISATRLTNITLDFPSKDEQKKIVECFSSIDEKIQSLKKKHSLLEQYKKGVMQKIFSQELRFKDENGNDFPEWEESKLGDLAEITIGEFVIKTKQNPNAKYPVYNGGKSYTGFYDEYNNEGNKIIISARGANAGFVNFAVGRYWAGNSCYSIGISDKTKYDILYFYHYVKMYESRFLQNQQAANIPSVSKKDAENFIIQIPSISEQNKISIYLSAIDEKTKNILFQIEKLDIWKNGLMQKMFC